MNLQGIAEAYSQVHEKKDSSYLETDMKKRQENNEKARKDMEKVKGQKNPHFEEAGADEKSMKKFQELQKNVDQKKKNIRGNDSEEQKARLEKKRGMKLDDHPQFKKEEVSGIAAAYQAVYDKEEVEMEGYKGKHGQSDKEYADSRSSGGKMVSGDSKMSGAEYTHGRRVKAENPGMQPDVGGKTKPKSQGKMDKGTRADMTFRKAALRKEELEGNPVYEATKTDIKEFVGAMLGNAAKGIAQGAVNSAGQALATPVGAGLAAGTVGAVTGGKKKVKKSLATGAGAAAGAALGGLPGAVIGGVAGNALS